MWLRSLLEGHTALLLWEHFFPAPCSRSCRACYSLPLLKTEGTNTYRSIKHTMQVKINRLFHILAWFTIYGSNIWLKLPQICHGHLTFIYLFIYFLLSFIVLTHKHLVRNQYNHVLSFSIKWLCFKYYLLVTKVHAFSDCFIISFFFPWGRI